MTKSTILKIERILLVTLQDETTSSDTGDIVAEVGDAVVAQAALGVLLDVSTLSLVDSYMARTLANVIGMTRLLGANAVIAGIRPEVAIAMVELGIELPDVTAALNVDIALGLLRRLTEPWI